MTLENGSAARKIDLERSKDFRSILGEDLYILLDKFLQDTPALLERLFDLAIERQFGEITDLSRVLEHTANNLGINTITESCRSLVTILMSSDVSNVMMAVGKIEFEFKKFKEAMEKGEWPKTPAKTSEIKRY
ncbi:MAG: hypothetical protein OEX00_10250 [Gammaproteobacteria bacterium]|nr:hypothetical protein [Gammaproteobacteria bacterium]